MAEHNSSTEEWRPIVGSEGRYEVSSEGRVRSLRLRNRMSDKLCQPPRLLALCENGSGYLAAYVGRTRLVAGLVLEAFVGPRPNGMQSAHQDGNKQNNSVDNLRWMTPKANSLQKWEHGTMQQGEDNAAHRLTEDAVREIRQCASTEKRADLARRFGVCEDSVYNVLSRKRWGHVQ